MIDVVCTIIVDNGKVLVVQKSGESNHPFKWEFPGGKINPGESEEFALKREIIEELNIDIIVEQRLQPIYYDYVFKKIVLIPFLCTIKRGNLTLNEHIDYKWLSIKELFDLDFAKADKKLIELPENREALFNYSRKNLNQ